MRSSPLGLFAFYPAPIRDLSIPTVTVGVDRSTEITRRWLETLLKQGVDDPRLGKEERRYRWNFLPV